MKRCRTCGHVVESTYEKLQGYVFVWTAMTVLIWGMMLTTAEWSAQWWRDRTQLVLMFAAIPVVAGYFWVQLLRERKRRQRRPAERDAKV